MAGTIQQIAELAGVSRGTVDRALNDRGRINPEVKAEILRIAEEIGYQPKRRTPGGKKKRTRKIGVVTQLAKASFMIEINRGIEEAKTKLNDQGIELIIKSVDSVDEREQLKALEELEAVGIDGLAIMPVDSELIRKKLNQFTDQKKIPVISFNSDLVGTRRSCFVGMDNRRSGRTAAGLMGMLTGGRGKILIITGYFSNSANSSRVDGFIEEMKQSFPEMEVAGVLGSYDAAEEVEKIIINAMTGFTDISGIFVVSGGQAGVGRAFQALNLEKRPKVIVYDKIPKNIQALKEDMVDFLIDQEAFEQGYQPPMILADILLNGRVPEQEYVYMDINIKMKYNV